MNAIKLFSFLSIIWALLISNPVKADTIPKQIHVIKLDTIKSFLSHLSQNNPITIPLENDIIDEIKRHIRPRHQIDVIKPGTAFIGIDVVHAMHVHVL